MSLEDVKNGGKGDKRRKGTGYAESYGRIFGKEQIKGGRYIQDPVTHRMVPVAEYDFHDDDCSAPSVLRPIDPFVSPVDGSVISDRSHLRAHNKRHGVTNVRDYGEGWFERRGKEKYAESQGTTRVAKKERIEAIKHALYKHGV